jgi:hypothetical protein
MIGAKFDCQARVQEGTQRFRIRDRRGGSAAERQYRHCKFQESRNRHMDEVSRNQ